MSELIALPFASRLGRWFEHRLIDCPPAPSATPGLYGLEIVDPDGLDTLSPTAVRVVYLGECAHDAVAIVHTTARLAGASVDGDEVHHDVHVDARGQLQCRVALAVEHL
jgi:hypothetical protein